MKIQGTGQSLPGQPKQVATLGLDDAFANLAAGGGGLGDPLDRPYAQVADDGAVTFALIPQPVVE